MKIKILAHTIAITCFLVGAVFIHIRVNAISIYLTFFNLLIHRTVVFDSGFVLLGIAFFIEFYMSFKPIEIKQNNKHGKFKG